MQVVVRALSLMVLVSPAFADTVVLKNADRITGEVQQLEKGRLAVKTSYAGTIGIEWSEVERVSTEQAFEIEAESGFRVTGTIEGVPDWLVVRTSSDRTIEVPVLSVIAINPAPEAGDDGFWRRVKGVVDVGYTLTRGNSRLNQSSLGLNGRYRTSTYQLQVNLGSLFSRQSDAPTTSRHTGEIRNDFFHGPRMFTFALTGLERDDRQRLDLRTNLGGGLGWKLIKSAATELSLLGGLTFINEDFRPDDASDVGRRNSSGEGLAGLDLDTGAVGRIRLTTKLSFHPNLLEGGRYRVSFEGGMRVPLISRFTWNLRLFDRFDSRPRRAVQRNDYGVISGFGVTF